MWTLRIILIVAGLLLLVALYLYTRRHPPKRKSRPEPDVVRRIEPDWSALPDTAIETSESSVPNAPPPEPPPPATRKEKTPTPRHEVFTLSVRLPGEGATSEKVVRTLKHLGCTPSPAGIYYYPGSGEHPLYRVANLFEPGLLEPLSADSRLRGLAFFFEARPGADATASLDSMLGAARECARCLGGEVQDAHHRPLTAARELELKMAAARDG